MKPKCFQLPILAIALLCSAATGQTATAPNEAGSRFKIEVIDPAFEQLIDPAAKFSVLADGFTWSEGPVWRKAEGVLCFSDVPENKIYQIENGQAKIFLQPSGYEGPSGEREPGSNGLAVDDAGQLIVCDHGNRRVYRLGKDGKSKETIVDRFEGKRFNSPNDLVVKSNGDIFFTDPPYGLKDKSKQEQGFFGVYCIKADRDVQLVTKELVRPNGIGLSPDEKTLYVAQSHRPRPVYMKYAIDDQGGFGEGEVLYDCSEYASDPKTNPGMPDGMCVDIHGNLWATGPGGVLVISPAGKLLGRVYTGKLTANCTFTQDGSVLAMTADDQILSVPTKTQALGDWGSANDHQLIPVQVVTELGQLIAEMRSLIEAKKYAGVVELVAPPQWVQQVKADGTFEKVAAEFGERKVPRMKKLLSAISFTKAEYSAANNTVSFSTPDGVGRKAVFLKSGGKWTLRN